MNSNVFNKVEQPLARSSGRQESDGFAIFIAARQIRAPRVTNNTESPRGTPGDKVIVAL